MNTQVSPSCGTVPPRWAWHRRELLRARRVLEDELEERIRALRDSRGEPSGDVAEVGSTAEQRYELLAELRGQVTELAEIEAALARMRDGTYGTCELTGKPIAAARLRAIPWARFAPALADTSAARPRRRKGS